jgi:3-carboxy-cis,cis-muconate cycloisomerase
MHVLLQTIHTMISSNLTGLMFSTEVMQQVFSDRACIQRMLDFEAALARAEAQHGVIPEAAVTAIADCCDAAMMDMSALAQAAASAGNLAIPLVKQLTALVARSDAEAAKYVHWGATSQDVIDTGLVLQLREALDLIDADLAQLTDALASLAQQQRQTPMVGRTWLQHALPITFGLKIAGWLDAMLRHQQRLEEARPRLLALQFGGAAGTLASLGDRGQQVAAALAHDLQLASPDMPWHTQRDRMVEAATLLGMLTGSLGKMARDISLQMQTDVGEVAEPAGEGKGGSSTMPHKRNPVAAATAVAASIMAPNLAATILAAQVGEHERSAGPWHAEWPTLPMLQLVTSGALAAIVDIAEGMEVDAARMRANLDATRGLIMAEAVTFALAEKIGKSEAHHLVEAASKKAVASKAGLREVLGKDAKVTAHLTGEQLTNLFEPMAYQGASQALIDRLLASLDEKQ